MAPMFIAVFVLTFVRADASVEWQWPWQQSPTIGTPLGSVKGTSLNRHTMAFFDLPYAEPMRPSRRFRQPLPKLPWEGELDATGPCGERGGQCVQAGGADGVEDCLFLNVWAPKSAQTSPVPVLVFIHGGGFTGGSGCVADGQRLSEQGLVVVSMNYRLGVLGFLQHEQLHGEDPRWPSYGGMNGIADQLEALRWVQKNIAAFGGDATSVTIWGESAGGQSVCALTATPLAAGLVKRSIVESGNCITGGDGYGYGWGPATLKQGLAEGDRLFEQFNVSTLAELRAMDAAELVAQTPDRTYIPEKTSFRSHWSVDGHIFPEHPRELWKAGRLQVSSLMAGGLSADGLLESPYSFAALLANISLSAKMSDANIDAALATFFGEGRSRIRQQYLPSTRRFGRDDAAIIKAYRDSAVLCPSATMASLATQAHVQSYVYGWGAPGSGALFRLAFGVDHAMPHALELGAFGFPESFGIPGRLLYTRKTAQTVTEYWASFAKTGVPRDSSQNVPWPIFGGPTNATSPLAPYLYLGDGHPVINGDVDSDLTLPTPEDCAFWESFIGAAAHQDSVLV